MGLSTAHTYINEAVARGSHKAIRATPQVPRANLRRECSRHRPQPCCWHHRAAQCIIIVVTKRVQAYAPTNQLAAQPR